MSTYVFTNRLTNSLKASVVAESEDEAWDILQGRIEDALDNLLIQMPGIHTWELSTAF
jgi:hypothetical protein